MYVHAHTHLIVFLLSVFMSHTCVCVQVFLGGGAQLLQLQQDLIPRTSQLLSSYHLLKHVSQSLASSVPISTM